MVNALCQRLGSCIAFFLWQLLEIPYIHIYGVVLKFSGEGSLGGSVTVSNSSARWVSTGRRSGSGASFFVDLKTRTEPWKPRSLDEFYLYRNIVGSTPSFLGQHSRKGAQNGGVYPRYIHF